MMRRSKISLLLLVALSLSPLGPGSALAQNATPAAPAPADAGANPPKKERKATGSMSEATYRQLERIYKLMAENKNGEALTKLQELLPKVNGAYEKCLVLQTEGYVYANQNNYKKAIEVFEQALNLDSLPQVPYEQLLYNIGQMQVATEQFDKAIATMERYMREVSKPPAPDAYIVLASAYAEKKRFKDALVNVDKAISLVPKPREQWLQLKLALHYELKDFPACAQTLLTLISVAPAKKDYWKQLSSVFLEIKQDKDALAVLALADRQGFLSEEREFRNLGNIYLLLEIPYKAGVVLQRGLDQKVLKEDEKTLLLLADAWLLAREYDKSAKVLQRAAETTGKGDIYYRLAQIYVEDEKWKPALTALDQALKKGVTKQGQAAFLAGVAAYQLGDKNTARKQLQRAMETEDTRKQAQQWLAFMAQQEGTEIADAGALTPSEQQTDQKAAEAAPAEKKAAEAATQKPEQKPAQQKPTQKPAEQKPAAAKPAPVPAKPAQQKPAAPAPVKKK